MCIKARGFEFDYSLCVAMATRYIEKKSKKVSDSVNFKWKIENFTIDDLPIDQSPMKSPSFECFKAVFCVEIARTSDEVRLHLTQSNDVNPPWISDCTMGLTYLDECDRHFERFTAPTKPADITCSFAVSEIEKETPSWVLTVCCDFTASTLVEVLDDESDKKAEESNAEWHESESESGGLEIESDESEIESDESEIESDESEIESDGPGIEFDEPEIESDESGSVERDSEPDESDEHKEFLLTAFMLSNKIMHNLALDLGEALVHCSFSDVTLKVSGEEFKAHKIILASRSKVFQAMFGTDMKESRQNVVDVLEMKPSVAKEMLQFIYSGKIDPLTVDGALDLYVAADRYDLPDLKLWCQRIIQVFLTSKEMLQVAELAHMYEDKELAEAVRRVFKEKSESTQVSQKWRDFAKKNPVLYSNLIEGDQFLVSNEWRDFAENNPVLYSNLMESD